VTEIAGHDADDRVGVGVHHDLASDDVCRGAERAVPQAIADHHGVGKPRRGVLEAVDASERRACAEQLKIIRAGHKHLDALGALAAEKRRADRPYCRDAFEDAGADSEIVELGLRDADVSAASCFGVRRDTNETVGIRKWQRPNEHRVDHGENCDVRANPECEGHRRDDREPGCRDKSSQGMAQVANQ